MCKKQQLTNLFKTALPMNFGIPITKLHCGIPITQLHCGIPITQLHCGIPIHMPYSFPLLSFTTVVKYCLLLMAMLLCSANYFSSSDWRLCSVQHNNRFWPDVWRERRRGGQTGPARCSGTPTLRWLKSIVNYRL